MLQSHGEVDFKNHKTGFQARYSNPIYEKIFLDRLEASFPEKIADPKAKRAPPEESSESEKNNQKLNELVWGSEQTLLKIKTAIPLNPFPTHVVIDINKINIILKQFFYSEYVHGILIKDVSDVIVETGLIWATLRIIDIGFIENSVDIHYLKKREAIKARSIIQGLVVAQKHGVDLSQVDDETLCEKLEELGTSSGTQ